MLTTKGRSAYGTAEQFQQQRVREHLVDALAPDQLAALAEISEAVLGRLGIACTEARAGAADL